MNSDRKRHSISAEKLCGYTRQHRHSMLLLAQFKTTTICDSAMSATYSKNIQTVSFFMWKELEFRQNAGLLGDTCSVLSQHGEVFPKGYVLLIHLEAERNDKISVAYTINIKNLISYLALDSLQESWKGRLVKLKGIFRNTDVMHYLS